MLVFLGLEPELAQLLVGEGGGAVGVGEGGDLDEELVVFGGLLLLGRVEGVLADDLDLGVLARLEHPLVGLDEVVGGRVGLHLEEEGDAAHVAQGDRRGRLLVYQVRLELQPRDGLHSHEFFPRVACGRGAHD